MHKPIKREHPSAKKMGIFIHGFMGSPDPFSDLMDAVYDRGISVASVLLPGHGGSVKKFVTHGMKDWEKYLENEIDGCSKRYEKIYLVGHSMGGLLALNASLKKTNNIAGVFMISTPLKISLFRFKSLEPRWRLIRYPKDHAIKAAYLKSNSISNSGILTYSLFLKPVFEFYKLVRKTKRNLSEIIVPVYMIHSRNDELVSFKSAEMFKKGLVGAPWKALTLRKSWHAYFPEDERAKILEKLLSFICA